MLQTIHLYFQHTWIATIPAIANNQYYSATSQYPLGPLLIKKVQSITYTSSARPILHRFGNITHCIIYITPFELACNTCQPGSKDKRLDVHQAIRYCMNKMQYEP